MLETEFIAATDRNSRRLMAVMHGLGDSPAGFHWLPEALNLPWLNYLLIQAPDPYFGGYSWYDFSGDPGAGIRRSVKLVFELLDDLRGRGFATEQTILSGFSQGCLMTMECGARYPHRFAGLVGISGYVFEPENLISQFSPEARKQRFLVTHGTADPLIPFADVKIQIQQLRVAGLDIAWHEFQKAHTIAGEPELAVIREFIKAGFAAA